jgi:hypothetical protein
MGPDRRNNPKADLNSAGAGNVGPHINLIYYTGFSNPHHHSRPSSVVERVAFNHVVVGSIPTDGVVINFIYISFFFLNLVFRISIRSNEF